MADSYRSWRNYLFDTGISFREKALAVYRHQIAHQSQYRRFCRELDIENPESDHDIPLMPIQVFRDARVRAKYVSVPEAVFRSSGTTGSRRSTHEIADLTLYQESCYRGFSRFYNPEELVLMACLPRYSDHPDSSLIAMVEHLVRRDSSGLSRILPVSRIPAHPHIPSPAQTIEQRLAHSVEQSSDQPPEQLSAKTQKQAPGKTPEQPLEQPSEQPSGQPLGEDHLATIRNKNRRLMLFGTAFGLLDMMEAGVPQLPHNSIIVETGGMKTRHREIPKAELHERLATGFGLVPESIHSEYGMAEMCSQAWDTGTGWFQCPPWLRITIRDPENPMKRMSHGEEGLIGVTDLANVHSISFLLTQDRGVARPDGNFRILGRLDHAELRGCNFLME